MPAKPRALVIGVGNAYRSDDAVGLIVAHRLRTLASNHVTVLEQSGEGTHLMEAWKDSETVILLDAVFSGAKAGTIHRFDARLQRVPRDFFRYSTHAFGVSDAIELARALDRLPPRLVVYGIEGKSFEVGTQLSLEVEKATQELTELLLQELSSAGRS